MRFHTLIYYDDKNFLHQIGHSSHDSTSTYDSSTLQLNPNFKLKWTTGEIKQFNDAILTKLSKRNDEIIKKNDSRDESKENSNETKQVKYDGLIYIISGHGYSDKVFLDSDGNKISLNDVFFDPFSNKNCEYFYGKPKLFIVDCCGGTMTSKKIINEKYVGDESDGIMVNVQTNGKGKAADVDATPKAATSTKFEKDYDNLEDGDKEKHDRDDMRCIFGNPDIYKVVDSTNGGYLTCTLMFRLCKNKNTHEKLSFDQLLKH